MEKAGDIDKSSFCAVVAAKDDGSGSNEVLDEKD